MEMCLRVLKESNKSRFDSYSRQQQCIDHIPYYLSGLLRAHFFQQPFSKYLYTKLLQLRKESLRKKFQACTAEIIDRHARFALQCLEK